MKRKIFSKLLAGALLVASVSSFVSCKDYDDDINNLQKQIDNAALKSDLSALQTTLTSVQSTANSAATSAQEALTKAGANATDIATLKSTAASLGTQVADAAKAAAAASDAAKAATDAAAAAKSASEDAVAAAAVAAAAAGEEAVKQAEEKVNAAVADFTAKFDAVNAAAQGAASKDELEAVKKNAEALAKAAMDEAAAKATKADIDAAIAALNLVTMDDVNKAIADAIAAAGAAQGTSQALGWEKAVTSVELLAGNTVPGSDVNLRFLTGVEIDNVFGSATKGGNYVKGYAAAEEEKTYVKGDSIKFDNHFVVRVSPVDATITADQIILQNSLGETLNDYVDITVKPYDKLVTRAEKTGLWEVTVIRNKSAKDADFQKVSHGLAVTAAADQRTGDAGFAIAINNTEDVASRYAVSPYQLTATYGKYHPATDFGFSVKSGNTTTAIANLHNRWNMTGGAAVTQNKLIGEDGTREAPKAGKWNAELVWAAINAAGDYDVAKDTATVGDKKNYAYGDERYANATYVNVNKDAREFTVKAVTGPLAINQIQYYYVTLDKFAAVESAPSEYEAWNSYDITNLNTVTPASQDLTLTVNSAEAIGDVIGFRVVAVNYDGSLADPDGKAFYVKIGTPVETASASVSVSFTAANANAVANATAIGAIANELAPGKTITGTYNLGVAAFNPVAAGFKMDATTTFQGTKSVAATASATDAIYAGATYNSVDIHWALLDKNYAIATALSNVKFVGVAIDHAGNFLDGGSYAFSVNTGVDSDHHNLATNKLTINVSKQFLSAPVGFSWKPTYEPVGGVKTFYPVPNSVIANQWKDNSTGFPNWAAWTAAPTSGKVLSDMNNFASGINASYAWNFWAKSDKKTAIATSDIDGSSTYPYIFVPASRIGTSTKKVYGEYGLVYAGISCYDADEDGTPDAEQNKMVLAFAGDVVFEDVNTLSTFTVNEYTYCTTAFVTGTTQATKKSALYAVPFNAPTTGISQYNLGYNAGAEGTKAPGTGTNLNLATILTQTNSVASVMNNVAFTPANWPTVVSAKVGDGSLLTATYAPTTGLLTFAAVAASAPLGDVEQNVEIVLQDVLGNKTTITFPIMVIPTAKTAGWMQ